MGEDDNIMIYFGKYFGRSTHFILFFPKQCISIQNSISFTLSYLKGKWTKSGVETIIFNLVNINEEKKKGKKERKKTTQLLQGRLSFNDRQIA